MHAKLEDRAARGKVAAALFALFIIWGSTFLAIRVALAGFPPLLLGSSRFLVAGAGLYAVLRLRGAPRPTAGQWGGALLVGTLLCGSNALVVVSEQWVSTSLTAVIISSVPLWAALISGLFGRWPAGREWVGLAVGFTGVALLQLGSEVRASPLGVVLLLVAAVAWAFGSIWSLKLPLPGGLMTSAAQMLTGGVMVFLAALVHGERFAAMPGLLPLSAFFYLVLFGSMVGYSAYAYLLATVRPTVATSYGYVNPIVAVILGVAFMGEQLTLGMAACLLMILSGVAIVLWRKP
jgi:drug/metabolite transporter (DMT)-like permease